MRGAQGLGGPRRWGCGVCLRAANKQGGFQAAAYGAMLGGLMCALELRGLREKRPSAGTSYRRALLCRRSQPESVLAPDAGLAELTQR